MVHVTSVSAGSVRAWPRRAWAVLCLVAALTALLVARPLGARGADAGTCAPAGGADAPFAVQDGTTVEPGDVVLNGGGWGHGVGMSQWGAQGAALLGCDHPTILSTYYPGTTIAPNPSDREAIAVHWRRVGTGKAATIRTTTASAGGVDLPWLACDLAGTTCAEAVRQPAGSEWVVTAFGDGTFALHDAATAAAACPVAPAGEPSSPPGCHWRGGDYETRLRLAHEGTVIRIVELNRRVKWGFVEFDWSSVEGGVTFVTQYITDGPEDDALDRYLWGLAEMPSSWEGAALRTQAIAGRSYAEATMRSRETVYGRTNGYVDQNNRCRCDIYATTVDQVYLGFDHEENEAADGVASWKQAVTDTARQVMLHGDAPIAAYYSSSHGGWSEDVAHVWGANLPYLPAVDTSRWEERTACGPERTRGCNTRQRWTRTFSRAELATTFGFAEFDRIEVLERGPGGRPTRQNGGGIHVHGRDANGDAVVRRYHSESIRSKLSLYSGLIHVGDAPGNDAFPARRVAGATRVGTSVATSQAGWEDGVGGTVVLARVDDPADALAGGSLAGALHAPLLLNPTAALDPLVRDEVQRIGATDAVLLGGPKALSEEVAGALRDLGLTVRRVAGATRAETASAVADELAPAAGTTAVLIRGLFPEHPGRQWADALAVAGLTARRADQGAPWVVLVTSETVHPATWEAMERHGVADVVIAGGRGTIPEGVEAELDAAGLPWTRLAGASRYETSRLALELDDPPNGGPLVIATGDDHSDGLGAGALAGHRGGGLLLVPSSSLDNATGHEAWLRANGWRFGEVVVIGGTGAVTAETYDRIRSAVAASHEAGPPPEPAASAEPSPEPSPAASPSPSPVPSPTGSRRPGPAPSPTPSPSPAG